MMRQHGPAQADHGPAKAGHYVLAGLIVLLGTALAAQSIVNISSLETVSSTCGG